MARCRGSDGSQHGTPAWVGSEGTAQAPLLCPLLLAGSCLLGWGGVRRSAPGRDPPPRAPAAPPCPGFPSPFCKVLPTASAELLLRLPITRPGELPEPRFHPVISCRGDHNELQPKCHRHHAGCCPGTAAPLTTSPRPRSRHLLSANTHPQGTASLSSSCRPCTNSSPLILFLGGRNLGESCLSPWGTHMVGLSGKQPRTQEGGGGRKGGRLSPSRRGAPRSAPRCFSNGAGDFLRVYFQCRPAQAARGAPAVARTAQNLRALKDLVLWHSADSEGEGAFHVQNKGGERAFLFGGARKRTVNAAHPWRRGAALSAEQSRHERQRGREKEQVFPSH